MRILIAITGASGTGYAQRLLDHLDVGAHDVHLIMSKYAQVVIKEELPDGLQVPGGVHQHSLNSMNIPFASGSNPADVMVIIPCTMGTVGRVAHGFADDALLRCADVSLKEKKKLVLVPRETPLSLVHVKNFELLMQAGATLIPANPSFYARPTTVEEVMDTVVARVLDHMGIAHEIGSRWREEEE
jgi:4-hydroxy-3-polyprenylbenzoate decarboxylase